MSKKGSGLRVRLEDVARAANVSKSTASKILNDAPDLSVRSETKRRVFEVAAALGYQPHEAARALAGAPARALALLVPELTSPIYSQMVRGAFAQAQTRGYTVLVAEDYEDQQVNARISSLVAAGRVDGILVASGGKGIPLANSFANGIPHVFLNRPVPGSGRNVTVHMAEAISLAVSHFVDLGHRTIGQIAGPNDITSARIRSQAFAVATKRLGVEAVSVHAEFDEAGGADGAARLFARMPHVTALLCNSLSQAVGATSFIHSRGLRIPDDVSVIAYDDLPLADFLSPPLDTIAMPLAKAGHFAVDALIEQIEGGPAHDVDVPDDPQLVLRGSSRRLRRSVSASIPAPSST